ncbi:hypothetical protein KR222_007689, partial [Zaprionus bogoriensis]
YAMESSACFRRGTYIELSSGVLRRVEDIRTEDFIQSAVRSQLFDLREATVLRIDRSAAQHSVSVITFNHSAQQQVQLEVLPAQPLFVYGQGWASCNPQLSYELYELKCQQLQVGDICLSLVPHEQPPPPPPAPVEPSTSLGTVGNYTLEPRHPYQVYAEMANLVAAYTQHLIGKMRN